MAKDSIAQRAAYAAINAMKEKEGLSQSDIARRIGTSQATVSRLANGEATPDSYGNILSSPSVRKYVPGDLMSELEASKEPLRRDRIAELESRVAAVEAVLAKLTGG